MQRDNLQYGDDLPGLSLRLQECLSDAKIAVEYLQREIERKTDHKDGTTYKDLEEIRGMLRRLLHKTNMMMLANGVSEWSKV